MSTMGNVVKSSLNSAHMHAVDSSTISVHQNVAVGLHRSCYKTNQIKLPSLASAPTPACAKLQLSHTLLAPHTPILHHTLLNSTQRLSTKGLLALLHTRNLR